jgi:hypothetical protein
MSRAPVDIESIEHLQKHVPSIVRAVNADPALGLAAAVNPLYALEELGYRIPADLQRTVEHRIRFSEAQTGQLARLKAEIHEGLHKNFDIESDAELAAVLQKKLKLGKDQRFPAEIAHQPQLKWTEQHADPLEPLRSTHPVMPAILEYRKIEASEPRLGNRDLYDQVRRGAIKLPVKAVVFQLRRGHTPN